MMNAAVALGVPPARIVEHCDSVSFCFSKVGKLQEGGGAHCKRLSCVLGLLGRQVLRDISPVGFQSQMLWGFIS